MLHFLSWLPLCQKTAIQILSGSVSPLAGFCMESVALCVTLLMGSSRVSSLRKREVVCVIILCPQKDDT